MSKKSDGIEFEQWFDLMSNDVQKRTGNRPRDSDAWLPDYEDDKPWQEAADETVVDYTD